MTVRKSHSLTQHEKLDKVIEDVNDIKVQVGKLTTCVDYLNKFLWMVMGVTVIGVLEDVFKLFTNHVPHWLQGGIHMESFKDLILFLASPAVIGLVASYVVQLLKKLNVNIKDELAQYVSILVGIVVVAVAQYFVPFVDVIPAILNQYFWILVVLWEQILYKWLTNINGMGFFVWKKK